MIWNHLNISTCRTQVKGAKIYNKCKIFVFCTSAKIIFSLWHILIHPYLSYFANFSELRAGRAYQFGVKIMLINCCQKIWSAGVSLKNIIFFFDKSTIPTLEPDWSWLVSLMMVRFIFPNSVDNKRFWFEKWNCGFFCSLVSLWWKKHKTNLN